MAHNQLFIATNKTAAADSTAFGRRKQVLLCHTVCSTPSHIRQAALHTVPLHNARMQRIIESNHDDATHAKKTVKGSPQRSLGRKIHNSKMLLNQTSWLVKLHACCDTNATAVRGIAHATVHHHSMLSNCAMQSQVSTWGPSQHPRSPKLLV
jgi:hypothetical protein